MPFTDPSANISTLRLEAGMKVVDFGSGSGAYALALAQAVGPSGTVYAVEIQKELLERLKAEAAERGFKNVEVIWGDVERLHGTKLADGLADAVVMANVLFQTNARYQVALEAKRVLRSGGKLLVVDWAGSFGGLGPHPDHILSPTELEPILTEAGFRLQKVFETGDHHFGMLLIK